MVAEAVDVVHLLAIERLDDVAALEARAIGCAVRCHGADDGAADVLETEAVGEIRRHRLHDDAELGATDVSVFPQVVHHVLGHVRRNREPDADVRVDRRQHLGVDADHFALRVHQGAARVAVVDRRVGLQEILVVAIAVARHARAGRTALLADDAHRHRLADAERVADGEHDVADLRVVGVAERRGLEVGRGDFHEREVARLVGADDFRVERASVVQIDVNLVRAVHDVVVGQDVAVARDDHARAETVLTEAARDAWSAPLLPAAA